MSAASPIPPVGVRKLPGVEVAHKPSPPVLDLDPGAIQIAANALGLVRLDASAFRAMHTIGGAVKKIGAVRVGRTQMIVGQQNVQDALRECSEIIASSEDPLHQLNAMQIKAKLIALQIRGGYDMVRTSEIDMDDDANPTPRPAPFLPGTVVNAQGPVQINNGPAAGSPASPVPPPQAPPPPGSGGPIPPTLTV